MTPRLKKKVPWKGKNILILLPRDEERGQPEKGNIPLSETATNNLFRSWEQLGYNIKGFDLDPPVGFSAPGEQSQSRGAWPDFEELVQERKRGNWTVLLPDLNGERLVVFLSVTVLTFKQLGRVTLMSSTRPSSARSVSLLERTSPQRHPSLQLRR